MLSSNTDSQSKQPWYIKKTLIENHETTNFMDRIFIYFKTLKNVLHKIFPYFLLLFFIGVSGFLFQFVFLDSLLSTKKLFVFISIFLFFISSFLIYIYHIGKICTYFSLKNSYENKILIGVHYLMGSLQKEEPRKGIPAPELALSQFVSQVKAYALEKSFLKHKIDVGQETNKVTNIDNSQILKRRWNAVVDSMHEFEIYLANDPKGCIEKLISKSRTQMMDVSQIFRDVADTFDAAWRRQGINIEQAIVTPLKADSHEVLLRRLLVGPWRSCVYFAKRGNDVIFSAKSLNGKIVARWECLGVSFPAEFYEMVKNNKLTVNDRIEKGLELIHPDATVISPNTLFALISFIIWLDLIAQVVVEHTVKQGSEGFIIELKI